MAGVLPGEILDPDNPEPEVGWDDPDPEQEEPEPDNPETDSSEPEEGWDDPDPEPEDPEPDNPETDSSEPEEGWDDPDPEPEDPEPDNPETDSSEPEEGWDDPDPEQEEPEPDNPETDSSEPEEGWDDPDPEQEEPEPDNPETDSSEPEEGWDDPDPEQEEPEPDNPETDSSEPEEGWDDPDPEPEDPEPDNPETDSSESEEGWDDPDPEPDDPEPDNPEIDLWEPEQEWDDPDPEPEDPEPDNPEMDFWEPEQERDDPDPETEDMVRNQEHDAVSCADVEKPLQEPPKSALEDRSTPRRDPKDDKPIHEELAPKFPEPELDQNQNPAPGADAEKPLQEPPKSALEDRSTPRRDPKDDKPIHEELAPKFPEPEPDQNQNPAPGADAEKPLQEPPKSSLEDRSTPRRDPKDDKPIHEELAPKFPEPELDQNQNPAPGADAEKPLQEPSTSALDARSTPSGVSDEKEEASGDQHEQKAQLEDNRPRSEAGEIAPKLQKVLQPAGMLLEVTPDYQGSYAAHRMKPAEPTPDMLAPRYTYELWSPCKGIAFILNNATFSSGHQRKGSDIDLENMVHLFQELGYMVMSHINKKCHEIKDLIRSFAAMFNQSIYDSAVVVLMSHGEKGVILGTDSVHVYLRDLQRELEGDRCPGLKGKPKMFFVQACRGGIWAPLPTPVVSDGPNSQLTGGESSPIPPEWILPVEPDNEFASSLRNKADFYFAYATIDGHISLRSDAVGSFFVQALCEVFFANAHRDNLDTLMNKVTGRVTGMLGSLYDHGSRRWIPVNQTPEVIKSMCKALYFLPKYSKTK